MRIHRPSAATAVLQASLAVLLLLLLGATLGKGMDYIQMHSLFPPILQNYWSNGMRYWAFGRNTVVTDGYVRLTDGLPQTTGYLWNRHENHMNAFELNVTVRVSNKVTGWFGETGHGGGIGIWYVNAQKVNYLSDASFYGFQKKFKGLGLVLESNRELSLIVNDADSDDDITPQLLHSRRAGSCTLPSHDDLHVTISLLYENSKQLLVFYTIHEGEEPVHADFAGNVVCTSKDSVAIEGTNHFGVTAANGVDTHTRHDVHGVYMTPLSDVSVHMIEEDNALNVRLLQRDSDDEVRV